jgi:hypothetical protein
LPIKQDLKDSLLQLISRALSERTDVPWAMPFNLNLSLSQNSLSSLRVIHTLELSMEESHKILGTSYTSELKWVPKLIMGATKIHCMTVEHLIFLDSLNFLPVSLKAMPKAFNLPNKGEYPHLFNMDQNLDYVGPSPDPKYYGVDFMATAERTR